MDRIVLEVYYLEMRPMSFNPAQKKAYLLFQKTYTSQHAIISLTDEDSLNSLIFCLMYPHCGISDIDCIKHCYYYFRDFFLQCNLKSNCLRLVLKTIGINSNLIILGRDL